MSVVGLNPNHPKPLLEGWLVKLGSFVPTWKRRYFVLDAKTSKLWYYKAAGDATEAGSISLLTSTLVVPPDSMVEIKKPHAFYLKHKDPEKDLEVTTWISTETAFELSKWTKALLQVIHSPLGSFAPVDRAKAIFGITLRDLAVRDHTLVPHIVTDSIATITKTALRCVGIYRLSGNASEIQDLKRRWNSGERVDLMAVSDPHAVSGLFKLFLRELPEPLFTFANYNEFMRISRSSPPETVQADLRGLLATLPLENRCVLFELLKHVIEVARFESENKMGIPNLVTVFAPNLLRPAEQDMSSMVADMSLVSRIVSIIFETGPGLLDGIPASYATGDPLANIGDGPNSGRSKSAVLGGAGASSGSPANAPPKPKIPSFLLKTTSSTDPLPPPGYPGRYPLGAKRKSTVDETSRPNVNPLYSSSSSSSSSTSFNNAPADPSAGNGSSSLYQSSSGPAPPRPTSGPAGPAPAGARPRSATTQIDSSSSSSSAPPPPLPSASSASSAPAPPLPTPAAAPEQTQDAPPPLPGNKPKKVVLPNDISDSNHERLNSPSKPLPPTPMLPKPRETLTDPPIGRATTVGFSERTETIDACYDSQSDNQSNPASNNASPLLPVATEPLASGPPRPGSAGSRQTPPPPPGRATIAYGPAGSPYKNLPQPPSGSSPLAAGSANSNNNNASANSSAPAGARSSLGPGAHALPGMAAQNPSPQRNGQSPQRNGPPPPAFLGRATVSQGSVASPVHSSHSGTGLARVQPIEEELQATKVELESRTREVVDLRAENERLRAELSELRAQLGH